MADNKKSFLLHKDSLNVLDELTDEQAGKLFKAIKNYQNGIDTKLDFGLKMAFLPFKNQFIRDLEKYKDQCGTNSKNGKLGGRPKKAKESEKSESVILKAKKADSDSDSDSDNVNANESVSVIANNYTPAPILGIDYIKAYNDLPDEFKNMYDEEFYKSWLNINSFISQHCQYLRKWSDQLTIIQFKNIFDRIVKKQIEIKQVQQAFLDLDGNRLAKEKYNSVYHGFNAYLKTIQKSA